MDNELFELCMIRDCKNARKLGGICETHMNRFTKYGTFDPQFDRIDLPGEEWRDIPGFEGRYKVSSHGRICSMRRKNAFGRIRRHWVDAKGYQHFGYRNEDGSMKKIGIHRAVAMAFHPNPENKPFVNHIDANPSNNHKDNLEWCTPKENMEWAVKLGHMNGSKKRKLVIALDDVEVKL